MYTILKLLFLLAQINILLKRMRERERERETEKERNREIEKERERSDLQIRDLLYEGGTD